MSQEKKKEEDFDEFHEFHVNSFQEFTDSRIPNDESDTNEFINFEAMDLDSQYRSISAVPPMATEFNLATRDLPPTGKESVFPFSQAPLSNATLTNRLDQPKRTMPAPKIEVIAPPARSTSSGKSSRPIAVPPEPFYVAPSTHFVTKKNVGDVKACVEVGLNSQLCVSFEFFPSKCRWEGVYLEGSIRCKFELNVYRRSSGGLVVEGNRLSGDSYAFVNVYKSILTVFHAAPKVTEQLPLIPPPRRAPDVDSIQKSITAVLAMANSGIGEAQLGASQIFCNLASDSSMHSALLGSGCIAALIELMKVEFQSCNQHAVCALAHLSASHGCQEVLMRDAEFLHSLLPLCSDGTYNSIEMRRECARLLANISCSGDGNGNAQQVIANAGVENIQTWLQSVDDLKDERLRVHADRAKVSLTSCT